MSLNKQQQRFGDNYSSRKRYSETKNFKTFSRCNTTSKENCPPWKPAG